VGIRHGEYDAVMAAASKVQAIDVLGTLVHDVTEDEALDLLTGFVISGAPHQVFTPNPEIVMVARRDAAFRAVLNGADLSIPDGIGLLLAARMAGTPFRQHVRGTDLVLRLANESATRGWRWFLLGAAPGVAEQAGRYLASRFAGLVVAGTRPGTPAANGDAETQAAIAAAAPVHVLLVAYGAPAQERWIARNSPAIGVPVQIGVGGVFNFFAGRSPRAPAWVRRLELEWAYRLATEPWRWRRQLVLPRFAALAAAEAVRQRGRRVHGR
jgi:N-acetylglucosaminyldiphosphoundecaprenol N-acetyl-beta-D-mannosaminyltransferase